MTASTQPFVPSSADIERMADDTIPCIERDSGQKLDGRMRAVVRHWLVRGMVDIRTATLAHQKADVKALLDRISDQMSLMR